MAQAVIWTEEICFQSQLRPAEMTTVTVQDKTAAGQRRDCLTWIDTAWTQLSLLHPRVKK